MSGVSKEQIESNMETIKYVGRSVQQTEEFFEQYIDPVLKENAEALGLSANISI